MPLKTGTRIGPFEITSPVGAGGMGEVYRAADTKLKRDVAIKVLPGTHAMDRQRVARFEREAHLLASLNHPHIASIYGLEESEDGPCLVMELVEGQTLAERLARRALPVKEALKLALQIASALEAAHEKGIIHRDLKPANVMVTNDGLVKVLDFGLAKMLEPETPGEDDSRLPTRTAAVTREGAAVGTLPYMSPEQVRGTRLDFGTDIWAFGCVLYEMMTGKRAFQGKAGMEVAAAILEKEPDWMALQERAPHAVVRLIRRCLRKDRHRRVQHVGDARIEVEDILEGADETAATKVVEVNRGIARRVLPWLAVGALVGAAVTFGFLRSSREAAGGDIVDRGPVQMTVDLPEGLSVTMGLIREMAVSPDGSRFVIAANDGKTQRLYIRTLQEAAARVVPGTEGASTPFFSADGEWIGYFAGGHLWKLRLSGGEPVNLGPAIPPGIRGAAWGPNGDIVMGAVGTRGLYLLPAAGGGSRAITSLDEDAGEIAHATPEFLPGGKTVLFTVVSNVTSSRIESLDLDSGSRRTLIPNGSVPRYVEGGYLVYCDGGVLNAVRFDAEAVRVSGSPVPVLNGVGVIGVSQAYYAVSLGGTLAYIAQDEAGTRRTLYRVDRNGVTVPIPLDEQAYESASLSADGQWLASVTRAPGAAIWVTPVGRLAPERLPLEEEVFHPIWNPDGSRITFSATWGGESDLYQVPVDGSADPVRLTRTSHIKQPTGWSPDGRWLAFQELRGGGQFELRLLHLTDGSGSGEPEVVVGDGVGGTISPDGHWLAYAVPGEGVFVQRFPGGAGRRKVSTGDGLYPAWSPKGDELFYVRGYPFLGQALPSREPLDPGSEEPPDFISVAFDPGSTPRFGEERVLFSRDLHYGRLGARSYDVAPDGRSFVIPGPDTGTAPSRIHVILNWRAELDERVPPAR